MPAQAAVIDDVLEGMSVDYWRDNAFADAMVAILKQHPVPECKHEMHHAVRGSFLRKARAGGYRDYAPGGMQYWRNHLREIASEDLGVPVDEVIAIHTLIYG